MPDRTEKLAGKAKEVTGKATGDDQLESEGRTQRTTEETKEKVEELGDKARGVVEGIKDKAHKDR